jgi:hypothetical protein
MYLRSIKHFGDSVCGRRKQSDLQVLFDVLDPAHAYQRDRNAGRGANELDRSLRIGIKAR